MSILAYIGLPNETLKGEDAGEGTWQVREAIHIDMLCIVCGRYRGHLRGRDLGSFEGTWGLFHELQVVQCVAVCCSVLQCVAVCCSVLQCVAVRCSAMQCVAVRCSALQCVAVHCSALQCVAVCCSALQWGWLTHVLWLITHASNGGNTHGGRDDFDTYKK